MDYIENNTWARIDMEFLFECLTLSLIPYVTQYFVISVSE